MPSCVLAYSGGLDTSVILGWLQDEGYEVHAVYVDLGQPCEDRQATLDKARTVAPNRPASSMSGRALPRFRLPGVAVAGQIRRHLSAGHFDRAAADLKVCLQVAREVGADAYAHGATGKGNDQCRFQLAAEVLDPAVQGDRSLAERFVPPDVSRPREMIAYCEANKSRSKRRSPSRTVPTKTACTSATRPASSKT